MLERASIDEAYVDVTDLALLELDERRRSGAGVQWAEATEWVRRGDGSDGGCPGGAGADGGRPGDGGTLGDSARLHSAAFWPKRLRIASMSAPKYAYSLAGADAIASIVAVRAPPKPIAAAGGAGPSGGDADDADDVVCVGVSGSLALSDLCVQERQKRPRHRRLFLSHPRAIDDYHMFLALARRAMGRHLSHAAVAPPSLSLSHTRTLTQMQRRGSFQAPSSSAGGRLSSHFLTNGA